MGFRKATEIRCHVGRRRGCTGPTRAAAWRSHVNWQLLLMKKFCFWMMKRGYFLLYGQDKGLVGKLV